MENLVLWRGNKQVMPGWSVRVAERLKPILQIEIVDAEKSEKIEIKSLDFSIEITKSGEGRGVIEKGQGDMLKLIVLMVAARESQSIDVTNDKAELVSISKFRRDQLHFQFQNSSFDEFMEVAKEVGLARSGAGAIMEGATTFF